MRGLVEMKWECGSMNRETQNYAISFEAGQIIVRLTLENENSYTESPLLFEGCEP